MGSFLANLHARSSDPAAIRTALGSLGAHDVRVTESDGGWVSVYEARASTQDVAWIGQLATGLSAAVQTEVVAFMVHDSDLLMCWVAKHGAIVSRIDTWPGFPDAEPDPTVDGVAGFLAVCAVPPTASALRHAVARPVVFADELLTVLAGYLGIAPARAHSDYRDGADAAARSPVPGGLEALRDQLLAAVPAAEPASPRALALVEAAHTGDVAAVDALVGEGEPVDTLAPWKPSNARSGPTAAVYPPISVTPLYAAAAENRSGVIRLLAELGADMDGMIPRGELPLHAAACKGHVGAVRTLLECGASASKTAANGLNARETLSAARQQLAMLRSAVPEGLDLGSALEGLLPDEEALTESADLLDDALR